MKQLICMCKSARIRRAQGILVVDIKSVTCDRSEAKYILQETNGHLLVLNHKNDLVAYSSNFTIQVISEED